ncbi:MAG: acyl-CoA dehydrogenase family protein [Pseudomonadota bacterium]
MSLAATTPKSHISDLLTDLREYSNTRINSALMDNRRCFSPHIVLDLGNMGILGQQVPEQFGGLGLSNQDCMAVSQQIGAIDLSLAIFVGLHNYLGIRPIMNFSQNAIKAYWLPQLATGRKLTAFALTEPGAGSNAGAIEGTARQLNNGRVRLNAQKMWIGNASWASVINVFARYYDANGKPFGINGYMVEQGIPGLEMGTELMTMGMRGMVQNRFSLNNAEVPISNQLGQPGKGLDVAQDAMMYTRLALGAIFLGAMKRTQQLLLRFVKRRHKIATGSLFEHPVCMIRMSEISHQISVQEALVNYISLSLDKHQDLPEEFLITAKVMGSEFLWDAADSASQFMGGRGYSETNEISRIIRDARVGRVFEGPTETMMNYMGSRLNAKDSTLRHYLSEKMNAPELADQLFEIRDKTAFYFKNHQGVFKGIKKRHLINSILGECIAWVILHAVANGDDQCNLDGRVIYWIKDKLKEKVNELSDVSKFAQATMDTAEIKSQIEIYEYAIGDMDQSMPGEEWSKDEYLTKGE